MSEANQSRTSPAKWALIGGLVLGFGSLIDGYQRAGDLSFAVGLAIGPAIIGAVAGFAAAHVMRLLSKRK